MNYSKPKFAVPFLLAFGDFRETFGGIRNAKSLCSIWFNAFAAVSDASAIQAVTPSDIFNWQGPTEYLVPSSERIWSEQKWYAFTGRVIDLRAEEDGDLHIALADVTGDKPGTVVVEIPAKPQWCELRTTVFSWTHTNFPFHTSSTKELKLDQSPVITVIGKAYFDVGHALKDQSNRRSHQPGYAGYEIHPVMKLIVQ